MVSVTSGVERNIVSGTPELSVSGLTVRFGTLTALEGVSLALRAGELVALAGENGAGKTTVIRSIAGDVTPVSGVIRVGGQAVAQRPRHVGRHQHGADAQARRREQPLHEQPSFDGEQPAVAAQIGIPEIRVVVQARVAGGRDRQLDQPRLRRRRDEPRQLLPLHRARRD